MRKLLYILGQLRDIDVEALAKMGSRAVIQPGMRLIEEGKFASNVFILLEGRLRVIHESAGGRVLSLLQAGEIVGEMSFVDAAPPSATVIADEECIVLSIPRGALAEKLENDVAFAARFYRAVATFLSDRLRATIDAAVTDDSSRKDGTLERDEIDPSVLRHLSIAGDRFDRMLRKLREI